MDSAVQECEEVVWVRGSRLGAGEGRGALVAGLLWSRMSVEDGCLVSFSVHASFTADMVYQQ